MLPRIPLLFATLCALISITTAREPVKFTLSFTAAAAHYVDVEMQVPTEGKSTLTLFMPVWTPGSYLVREYARNIVKLEAFTPSDSQLEVDKVTKNRWQITTLNSAYIIVRYRLYAREINVRGNWVESDFAMLNGAPTFLAEVDDLDRPYVVKVLRPAAWRTTQTPLRPGAEPDTFTTSDFDTLIDSPILSGSPQVDTFEVDGVPHSLVTLDGGDVWDNTLAAANLKLVIEAQRDFWGTLPLDEPYYIFNLLTGSRGGLEHRNAFTISADRWLGRTHGGIRSWLSLASHEYFHTWNGKRLRPVELGPFEYEHENHTKSLWIVEGITSYYQHVILTRAKFNTPDQYLGAVSGSIAGVQNTPGRHVQAFADSSFDAWIKAYRSDENSVNTLFSYYGGGAVAGFLIDAKIQEISEGTASLDDVMRAAYVRYSGLHGYTQEEFIAVASEVAGHDLSGWFDSLVNQPGEFDYQPALDWYGLEFEQTKPPSAPIPGTPAAAAPLDPPQGWLGASTADQSGRLVITQVRSDTPAAAAGLSVDDEIIAVAGLRVSRSQLDRRLELYGADTEVEFLISRRDQIRTLPVTLGLKPDQTWRLKFRQDMTEVQKTRVEKWLQARP
jgi:predicted metalloprotease with PDZ domain